MADKRIDELEAASVMDTGDLFVIEKGTKAMKVSGQVIMDWIRTVMDGHGGILNIAKTGSSGSDPVTDTYTITYFDGTSSTFEVKNGKKGDQGNPGPAATITSSSVQYTSSSSGTTVPTSGWADNLPSSVSPGDYLWTKIVINFSDGTPVAFYTAARMGLNGSGAVSSVCGVSPDGNGNVALTATNVGALPSSYTPPVSSVNGETGAVSLDASDVGALPSNTTAADLGAASLDSDSKVTASQASSKLIEKSASFTLALTDAGRMLTANSSSAITVTIPTNASVAFAVGTEIEVAQIGAGTVTFAADTGVTLLSIDSLASIAGQYGVAGLKKLDTNTWLLSGALT